jgi:hypothetical protein
LLVDPLGEDDEDFVVKLMGFPVLASAKKLSFRRIAGEVMAHSREFDEPGSSTKLARPG